MLSKFLEKKIQIEQKGNHGESGNVLELEYYLVESEIEQIEGYSGEREYGIEIVKKESGCINESKLFKSIFTDREMTESLLRKLIANSVTPVTLPYILEDCIGV